MAPQHRCLSQTASATLAPVRNLTLIAALTASTFLTIVTAAPALVIHAPENYDTQTLLRGWAADAAREVPVPSTSIRVRLQGCDTPGAYACLHSGRWGQIIDMPDPSYAVEPSVAGYFGGELALRARLIFIHEIGHAADFQPVRRPWRAAFVHALGLRPIGGTPGLRWKLAYDANGRVVRPSEWFADAYALCSVWPHEPPPLDMRSPGGYDYAPTPEQHNRACRIVRAMRLE